MKSWAYLIAGIVVGSVMTGGVGALPTTNSPSQDPVTQSPENYRVLLENDDVRVLEYRLRPGEKEPRHSHPEGVIYAFTASTVRSTLADGKVTESIGKAGDVFWRQPVTHSLENIGDTEVHSLAVEIKRR